MTSCKSDMAEKMTLEQVRNKLWEMPAMDRIDTIEIHEMADAIDAHLAQPVQAEW